MISSKKLNIHRETKTLTFFIKKRFIATAEFLTFEKTFEKCLLI